MVSMMRSVRTPGASEEGTRMEGNYCKLYTHIHHLPVDMGHRRSCSFKTEFFVHPVFFAFPHPYAETVHALLNKTQKRMSMKQFPEP